MMELISSKGPANVFRAQKGAAQESHGFFPTGSFLSTTPLGQLYLSLFGGKLTGRLDQRLGVRRKKEGAEGEAERWWALLRGSIFLAVGCGLLSAWVLFSCAPSDLQEEGVALTAGVVSVYFFLMFSVALISNILYASSSFFLLTQVLR